VYLDADLLVLRDISQLFTIDLGEAPFGAVRDFGGLAERLAPSPGLVPAYFNAGVLVVDVERWDAARIAERALEYAQAASPTEIPYADQDALNRVAKTWVPLDYMWNVQVESLFPKGHGASTAFAERFFVPRRWALYNSAAILHFTRIKPWKHTCMSPGTGKWIRTLNQTGWYTRAEMASWLMAFLARRSRFVLGTAWRRWSRSPAAARPASDLP
jgi:lipopolysaccharide biosynthesis glycosyltransferase